MTPDEYFRRCSLLYTANDSKQFYKATQGLPVRGPDEPFHCGPQNLEAFRYAIRFCEGSLTKPPDVLEIGMNLGHSAAIMLELGARRIITIEERNGQKQKKAADVIEDRFGRDRVGVIFGSTRHAGIKSAIAEQSTRLGFFMPDLAFVDGAHDFENVSEDLQLCLDLGVTRFLLDDWLFHWGPGVQPAAMAKGLVPIAVFGSMAYCVTGEGLQEWKDPIG